LFCRSKVQRFRVQRLNSEPQNPEPLPLGRIKFEIRQLDTGEGITVYGPGINTDFIGFHQGLTQGGVPENYRFAEIVSGG